MAMSLDLILRDGRVIDPSQEINSVMDVGFRDGRVAELGAGLEGKAFRDVAGLIVTPGLIDLHTHVYWGGSSLASIRGFSRAAALRRSSIPAAPGPATIRAFSSM